MYKTDLLICDELGYLSFSRAGAELLFQIFADRYHILEMNGEIYRFRESIKTGKKSNANWGYLVDST